MARSENRVAVLTTLGSTPIDRRELQERTGVERVTLGRILGDFEERGWVQKDGGQYVRTPIGEMVAGGIQRLLDTVDAAEKLSSVVQWLPTEKMPFDLEQLGDADITLPTGPDPQAPTRRAGHRLVETNDVRLIMSVIVVEVVDACWEATVNGNQRFEAVFTPEVVETITSDPTMAEQVGEMLAMDRVTVYQSKEPFPYIMARLDDIAAFGVTDDQDLPRAYFETHNDTVKSWVEQTYEHHLENAEPLELAN